MWPSTQPHLPNLALTTSHSQTFPIILFPPRKLLLHIAPRCATSNCRCSFRALPPHPFDFQRASTSCHLSLSLTLSPLHTHTIPTYIHIYTLSHKPTHYPLTIPYHTILYTIRHIAHLLLLAILLTRFRSCSLTSSASACTTTPTTHTRCVWLALLVLYLTA